MSAFDSDLYLKLEDVGKTTRLKWYYSAIVALGALNYPEGIPKLYQLLLQNTIPKSAQLRDSTEIRESLTKVCGIMGAAKSGSALRALATATPPELIDPVHYRKDDTPEKARLRGSGYFSRIYSKISGYDTSKTMNASPDYWHIVTDLFYGHIFSFDGVLNDFLTGQAIVSALIGIDCPEQAHNHMLGMLHQGADHQELECIRSIVITLANHYGARFKNPPIQVPTRLVDSL